MRLTRLLAAAATTLALTAPAVAITASPAGAADPLATLTAVHGIPGTDLGLADDALPVDVLINGELCALTDFRFGDVSPRLEVPAGSYDVEIKLSDGSCGGATAVALDDVEVTPGLNASIVAHLTEDAKPTASVFVNDLSPLSLWRTRVAVHHTAAAPAVDIDASYTDRDYPFISLDNVSNGQQGVEETWVGFYDIDIAPAGGETIFTAPATLWAYRLYNVYAVGNIATGTFRLIVDVQLAGRA